MPRRVRGADAASVFPSLEAKYNPGQPRVPAGSSGGGSTVASPMGRIDFDDLPSFSDLFALFQITPSETDNSDFDELAGDGPDGDGPELPSGEPPEIPQSRPTVPDERMSVVWDVVEWIGKKGQYSPAVSGYFGILNAAHWFKAYEEMTKTYYDPPETLDSFN
jgi:hypothetical protein